MPPRSEESSASPAARSSPSRRSEPAREPDQRYASASDLAQEVQRWQDVQRRQAEDALRRQTEILRSILNGMSEGVLVADTEGKLLRSEAPERTLETRLAA